MKSVLVTGGSGFIGRAVCAELVRRGVEVVAASRDPSLRIVGVRTLLTRDYCDFDRGNCTVCIHLAGRNVVPEGPGGEQTFIDETMALTRGTLDKGFRRIVYASTALVYDDRYFRPRVETDDVHPRSAYGRGKSMAEQVFLREGHVVARIANVYGIRMAKFNVLSHIISQLKGAAQIRLRNGTPVRDFIHVEDVGRAIADLAFGHELGIYNIGTGVGTSIAALVELVTATARETGRSVAFDVTDPIPSILVLDSTRIATVFNWKPQIALISGVGGLLASK